jgi:two-component system NtrC family sensor kinase
VYVKLGVKLIVSVGLSLLVIVGGFAYLSIRSQTQALLLEVERHTQQLAETVKSSTRFDMLMNNRDHLHQIINAIGTQENILQVRVFNKEGEIMYSSDQDQIGRMVDQGAEACFSCHASDQPLSRLPHDRRSRIFQQGEERVMGTIVPLYNDPSCSTADCHAHDPSQTVLGVIDITEGLRVTDELIANAKTKQLLFLFVVLGAMSFALWFFVRLWIDQPIQTLVEATQQVAAGNLHHEIDLPPRDELGILARSFDHMTKKLAEARLQLVQSDKMVSLGRLAAGVAHEINNPLTGILTYSSFLLKRSQAYPAIREDLEVIVRETKRSREIVKSLLDFARQSVPKKSKVALASICQRSLKVIDSQVAMKGISLRLAFEDSLPEVHADANQLQQVFLNLLVNAIHACPEQGGVIVVSAKNQSLAPFGLTPIRSALCPSGHQLMDHETKIHGLPAIRIKVLAGSAQGQVFLDPIYGKVRHVVDAHLPKEGCWQLFCPKCQISLLDTTQTCPECDSPVYGLETPGKGRLLGCTARGCHWQYWAAVEEMGKREFVEVAVQDNGCGIPKELLDKVFDPFFTTKGQQGTGLGLAVIWGIVDNHSGQISVNSEVGKGTTFRLSLPVHQEDRS